jgi:PAS domain S-box-containing protein
MAEEGLLLAKEQIERQKQKLERSVELIRATLESLPEAVVVTDAEGKVTDFNQSYLTMWGIQRPPEETDNTPSLLDVVHQQFADVHQTYASVEGDRVLIQLSNGMIVERSSCDLTLKGEPVGLVWTFRDVTDQAVSEETLQASHAKYAAIFDLSPAGMCLLDGELNLLFVSSKARDIFREIDLKGRHFLESLEDFLPDDQAKLLSRSIQDTLATGDAQNFDVAPSSASDELPGARYECGVHRVALPYGGTGIVCYFTNKCP